MRINRFLRASLIVLAATTAMVSPGFVSHTGMVLAASEPSSQAIQAAKIKDFSQVQVLLMLLESPYAEHPGFEAYADFPPSWASSIEISCSS